jgi:hypothetical protein
MLTLIPDADIIDRLSLQSRLDTINDKGRSVRSVQKRNNSGLWILGRSKKVLHD